MGIIKTQESQSWYLSKYNVATRNCLRSFTYNPRQNISNKMEKSGKLTGKESLVFIFSYFYLLLPKSNIFKGDWALGYVSTQIWGFPNIFYFPNILSLSSFCNSWSNTYNKFTILDIIFRLACGESDLY